MVATLGLITTRSGLDLTHLNARGGAEERRQAIRSADNDIDEAEELVGGMKVGLCIGSE